MKKYFFFIIIGIYSCLITFPVAAQSLPPLVQPLSWEQANLLAAREKKLVLVIVGAIDSKIEKSIQSHREVMNYLLRNVIAIRMDMNTPQGKEFKSRLLLYPYPTFAYFMPYSDLLEIVSPEKVAKNPEALREGLQKAMETAIVKKNNSRFIAFADISLKQAYTQAADEEKIVFVELYSPHNQASLLMERNVFNLNRVADFYNQHFISLRMDVNDAKEWVQKYALKEIPAFLYLNAKGKVLNQVTGYCTAEQLIQQGKAALEKAKGIPFENLTMAEAVNKAKNSGKLIFTDYYTPGSAHKEIVRMFFTDPEVTDFFTEHFVNVSQEADETVLIFTNAEGKEIHRVKSIIDVPDLLGQAQKVLHGRGLAGMNEEYRQGNRQAEFMEEYIVILSRAGQQMEASRITMEYLASFSPECLKESKYWNFFVQYGILAPPEFFDYVLIHREELYQLYGKAEVRKKMAALWVAGAENFVAGDKFDEIGFKEYVKRLKKEKVEDWRIIARNARMHAAEKMRDWKTFINLAEEKWNEEKISDAELYGWGVKINEQCHDENIRYKTAQWLAQKAMEMERKERITGKVKVSSYKGFFEKLVDDLLKDK